MAARPICLAVGTNDCWCAYMTLQSHKKSPADKNTYLYSSTEWVNDMTPANAVIVKRKRRLPRNDVGSGIDNCTRSLSLTTAVVYLNTIHRQTHLWHGATTSLTRMSYRTILHVGDSYFRHTSRLPARFLAATATVHVSTHRIMQYRHTQQLDDCIHLMCTTIHAQTDFKIRKEAA